MKRAEWIKDQIVTQNSPLGTPQFSVNKASNFRYNSENQSNIDDLLFESLGKHKDSLIPAQPKQEISKKYLPSHNKSTGVMSEIFSLRGFYEESITKIRKKYLQNERKLFSQLKNEEELQVLISTRPKLLEIPSRISTSPLLTSEIHFIDDNISSLPRKSSSKPFSDESLDLSGKYEENSDKEKEIRVLYKNYYNEKIHNRTKDFEFQLAEDLADKEYDLEITLENY